MKSKKIEKGRKNKTVPTIPEVRFGFVVNMQHSIACFKGQGLS